MYIILYLSNMNPNTNLDFEYPPLVNNIDKHLFFKEQIVLLYYNLTRKNNDMSSLSMMFDNLLCSLKQNIILDSNKQNTHKTKRHTKTRPTTKTTKETSIGVHDSGGGGGGGGGGNYIQYLVLLYKMVGQTRDCFYGKGEHDLSYMMLTVLYKYYPVLAIYALHTFVQPNYNGESGELGEFGELGELGELDERGYGSWRDLKYLCEYLRCNTSESIQHPLIKYCVRLMNNALKKDYDTWNDILDNYFQKIIHSSSFSSIETIKKPVAREHLSTVCKWIPREYKKFDWLNEMLVIDWFETYKPYILSSHTSVAGYYNSLNKCKLLYRKMVSKLNKVLDTTEIKLCSNQLDEIIPKNIPQSLFMKNKNKLWYSNICDNTKIGFVTSNNNSIQNKCATEFQRHFEQKFFLLSPFDPNREHNKLIPTDAPIYLFIKEAYKLYLYKSSQLSQDPQNYYCSNNSNNSNNSKSSQSLQLKIDILNHQWNQVSSIIGSDTLNDFIPIIDTSFDIDKLSNPFFSSIGFAFLICCRSSLCKRIITIDHQCSWINLEHCNDLFSMVTCFFDAISTNSNTNYNVLDAFDMIITSIAETKMSYRKIAKLSLVLFHQNNLPSQFHSLITKLFYTKGLLSSRGKPFPTPRIIYWNISGSGYSHLPFNITDENVFSLSGLSGSLIKHLYLLENLCNGKKGNSYDLICNILHQRRFETAPRMDAIVQTVNNRYDGLGNYLMKLYNKNI